MLEGTVDTHMTRSLGEARTHLQTPPSGLMPPLPQSSDSGTCPGGDRRNRMGNGTVLLASLEEWQGLAWESMHALCPRGNTNHAAPGLKQLPNLNPRASLCA